MYVIEGKIEVAKNVVPTVGRRTGLHVTESLIHTRRERGKRREHPLMDMPWRSTVCDIYIECPVANL